MRRLRQARKEEIARKDSLALMERRHRRLRLRRM
jgi:hypothetical protein